MFSVDITSILGASKKLFKKIKKKERIKQQIEKEVKKTVDDKELWKKAMKTKICMECGGNLYSKMEDPITCRGCHKVWYCKNCDFRKEDGIGIYFV